MARIKVLLGIVLCTLGLSLVLAACNKGQTNNPVPYVAINRTININDPQYQSLQQLNGFVYLDDEGYRGVVVMNDNVGGYVALERTCTHEVDRECSRVTMDENGWFLQCGHFDDEEFVACCGSKFDRDGGVVEGPAVYPLNRYQVKVDGPLVTIQN